MFIQVVQLSGRTKAGLDRELSSVELEVPGGELLDLDRDPTAPTPRWRVDGHILAVDPYYNGLDNQDRVRPGEQSSNPVPAIMLDHPQFPRAPEDIAVVTALFEVGVLCATGQNRGEWLGYMSWSKHRTFWPTENPKSLSTIFGTARGTPSASLLNALSFWGSRHGWDFPTGESKKKQGQECQ
ncbi:MAG TPA: hypothetical protein VD994_20155 [Prosthecobacter sp.]|nr:hypothetical protein [Candidatus Limnocylindrales bacterium]HYF37626.1 hypothetical protein [Prosthecobacter sp.]